MSTIKLQEVSAANQDQLSLVNTGRTVSQITDSDYYLIVDDTQKIKPLIKKKRTSHIEPKSINVYELIDDKSVLQGHFTKTHDDMNYSYWEKDADSPIKE